MRHLKRLIWSLLVLALAAGMCIVPAFTAESADFSEIPAGAGHADAMAYYTARSFTGSTSAAAFSPDTPINHTMLAAVLYRAMGSPAAATTVAFADVAADAWCADAQGAERGQFCFSRMQTLNPPDSLDPPDKAVRLSLAFHGQEVFVTMEDNATTQDFLTMLPITLTFEDFADSEKISNLPRSLSTAGNASAYDPTAGDLTLFVPWGNLAIFYRDSSGPSSSLIPMGHIDAGLELLTAQTGSFEVSVSIAS